MRRAVLLAIFVTALSPALACIDNGAIETLILDAFAKARFNETWDLSTNATTHAINNVDFSIIAFVPQSKLQQGCPSVVYANVLFSRDFPNGRVSTLESWAPQGEAGSVTGVQWRWWDYVRWEARNDKDWKHPPDGEWFGEIVPGLEGDVFMVPHPASTFKTMVATGVMMALQEGSLSLHDDASVNITTFPDGGEAVAWSGDLESALKAMLEVSDNSGTTACFNLLHKAGWLGKNTSTGPTGERLLDLFGQLGLHTLRLEETQSGGYWGPTRQYRNRSSDYDTTGFFHMTSWDAARLLWLLDPFAPAPTWLVNGSSGWQPVSSVPFLEVEYKRYLYNILKQQAWHEVLSTTAICGRPFRSVGIPSLQPAIWINSQGQVEVEGDITSLNVTDCQESASVIFAHKTGDTYTFGSDVGIVTSLAHPPPAAGRHYIITMLGNLGTRYTDEALAGISSDPCEDPDVHVCYTQRIATVGAAVDQFMAELFG